MDDRPPASTSRKRRRPGPLGSAAAAVATSLLASPTAGASLLRGPLGGSPGGSLAGNSSSAHRHDDIPRRLDDEGPTMTNLDAGRAPLSITAGRVAMDQPLASDPLIVSDPLHEFAVTTTAAATTAAARAIKWWPAELDGVRQCVSSASYPDAYVGTAQLLSDSEAACCETYLSVLGIDCGGGEDGAGEGPLLDLKPLKWYTALVDGVMQCVEGREWPDAYAESGGMLFDSEGECCDAFPVCGVQSDAVSTTATTAAPKPSKWYPTEIGGVRQCAFDDAWPDTFLTMHATFLFDDEFECCTTYRACPITTAAPGDAAQGGSEKEEMWYPLLEEGAAAISCVKDANYPDDFLDAKALFLFSSEEACCAVHPCPNPKRWHPELNEAGDALVCVLGDGYPQTFVMNPEGHLFETEEGCCGHYGVCATEQGADAGATAATSALPGAPKPDFWWPVEPTDGGTLHCEYSNDWPDAFIHEGSVALFTSHIDCCRAYHACPDKWHPLLVAGVKMCIFGSEYTLEAMGRETQEECCEIYGCDPLPSATTTTAPPQGEGGAERPPYWWPVEPTDGGRLHCEFSSNYPAAFFYEGSVTLFETEHACCSAYHACPEYWYPFAVDGVPSCVHGSNYPAEYADNPEFASSFLHDTQFECCGAFPSACAMLGWYPVEAADGLSGCEWGSGYPEEWVGNSVYVFGSEQECCDAWCGQSLGTVATVEAGSGAVTTAVAAETTTSTSRDPCTDCVWHESVESFGTCSNSDDYPSEWDEHPSARSWFFFRSAEDCCLERFPDDCTIEDAGDADHDTDFAPLGPNASDDFEAPGLPWHFGSPTQWQISNEHSITGSHSVSNVPVSGLGATADLTLKIIVPAPSTVSCMAKIDTSMPYDHFSLIVNGEKRNQYHTPLDGWVPVTTGIAPGKNTLVFRVQNADFEHNMEGERLEQLGTGRVWMDDCKVASVASDPN